MASLAELLTRTISSVQHPSEAQAEILERLSALRSRFDEGLLRVAVLGQFKRGKSTLLNALLGARILPTGVTPVTALPTFISAGDIHTGSDCVPGRQRAAAHRRRGRHLRRSRTLCFGDAKPAQSVRS